MQILLSSGSLYTGYYSYIGPENARMLGHQMDSYIVDCNFIVARGLQVSLEPCYKLSSNRTIPSTKYFNCYQMLYLAEDDASSTAVGISFILQHDNIMVDIPDAGPFNNLLWSQNIGSKLLMHPNNTIFDERTQGFSITVGQYSEVQMSGYFLRETTQALRQLLKTTNQSNLHEKWWFNKLRIQPVHSSLYRSYRQRWVWMSDCTVHRKALAQNPRAFT